MTTKRTSEIRETGLESAGIGDSGARYELFGPLPPHEPIGTWPRAGITELCAALDRANEFLEHDGAARVQSALAGILQRLSQPQPAPPTGDPLLARALGLEPAEAARHDPYDPLGLRAWTEAAAPASAERPEVALHAPHWSQLDVGFRRAVVRSLAAGRAVVVIAPERVPMIAERFARELAELGLPDGALVVLHATGEELLWRALEHPGFDVLVAAGHRELETRLRSRLLAAGGTGSARSAFGAGVHEPSRVRLEFEALGRADVHVHSDDDPRERAEAAAMLALGRSEALSGQLPGHVGRILCHPRRFAELTRALLALLESSPAFTNPLPPFDPDLPAQLERARELGLDEGATLILEGKPPSPAAGRWGRLFPLVFTNIEPGMRLAAPRRPMPLLLLSREPVALAGIPFGPGELGQRHEGRPPASAGIEPDDEGPEPTPV